MQVPHWAKLHRTDLVLLVALAVAGAVVAWRVSAGSAAPLAAVAAPASRLSFTHAATTAGTHRAPTASECTLFSHMLDASLPKIRQAAIDAGNTDGIAALDASAARSRSWLAKGCPYDPVLGVYPAADGSGGMIRLLDIDSVHSFRPTP